MWVVWCVITKVEVEDCQIYHNTANITSNDEKTLSGFSNKPESFISVKYIFTLEDNRNSPIQSWTSRKLTICETVKKIVML